MAKELDNKKMWESIIKNKTGFQNICVLDIVNALNDQGLTVEFDKIVSIEPESTIIKAGKWYVCDTEMINENMNVTFHRDEVYYCPKDGWIDVNGILFKVGSLCREFRPATPEETKWYITIKDFHDKDLDGDFNMPVFCQGEITTKEKVYDTIQYMDDTMFSAYFRPATPKEVLKAKHGITGIRFNKAESELGEMITERSICDYDHKKMLETLMQDSQRMTSAKAKEAGYDRPEQTNWTKNYDWNNGTMTIYNLSKEEHLKVVEFLDCLRHPDVPETDSGKKELRKIAIPKFKVGDLIEPCMFQNHYGTHQRRIIEIRDGYYFTNIYGEKLQIDGVDSCFKLIEKGEEPELTHSDVTKKNDQDELNEFDSKLCLLLQNFRYKEAPVTNGEIVDYVLEHSKELLSIARKGFIEEACEFIIHNFPSTSGITALMYADDFKKALEKGDNND